MAVSWFSPLVRWTANHPSRVVRKAGNFGLQKLANMMTRAGLSVTVSLGDQTIIVPANHASVFWVNFSSTVNRNLGRIAACVAEAEPTSTIVDVGANVGDTWLVLRGFGVPNRIIAIEGGSEPLRWLHLNTGHDLNTTVHEGFVGFGRRALSFQAQGGATSGVLFEQVLWAENADAVSLATLDEILDCVNAPSVRLIKIDTDGFDTLVARAAEQTIIRHHPVLFLEMQPYHLLRNDNVHSFIRWLSDFGYTSAFVGIMADDICAKSVFLTGGSYPNFYAFSTEHPSSHSWTSHMSIIQIHH